MKLHSKVKSKNCTVGFVLDRICVTYMVRLSGAKLRFTLCGDFTKQLASNNSAQLDTPLLIGTINELYEDWDGIRISSRYNAF